MVSLGCTTVALAALLAHVLELPNKLALPGPLWLAVQQNLFAVGERSSARSRWGPSSRRGPSSRSPADGAVSS